MEDHTVAIDSAGSPPEITFAPTFNAAVTFIDRHIGAGRGDKVAIRCDAGDVTYAELAERVRRAGNVLLGLGLAPGARVLMIVKDCPEFFYIFWGAIRAGIVPVPLNTLLRAADYRFMVDDSGAAAVVYSPEFAGEVEPALGQATHRPAHALAVDGEGETFAGLLADAATALAPAPTTAGDDCFWLYTSGSTGTPKGGVHAHRDMVVTSQRYGVETLGVTADDVHFSAAKLFFAYGLGNAMTFPLWTGGQAVLFAGRPTPETTFATIEAFRPTIYYGVPTLYAAQLQALETARTDLSSVRACVSAGEPLPAPILERWRAATGLDILDGIGTTEILHIFISNRPGDVHPGTSGHLVPGYAARLVDDDDNEVARGEVGNLMIRGGSVITEYWAQSGAHRAGDRRRVDPHRRYLLCRR